MDSELNLHHILDFNSRMGHDSTSLFHLLGLEDGTKVPCCTYPDHRSAPTDRSQQAMKGTLLVGDQAGLAVLRAANGARMAPGWTPPPETVKVDLDRGRVPDALHRHCTAIVRSKGGDHLYISFKDEMDPVKCRAAERALAVALQGDPAICRDAHTMRLPGFDHHKDPNHPYRVRLTYGGKPWPKGIRALLNAFGAEPVTNATWASYESWYAATKAGLSPDKVGGFPTETWEENRSSVEVFLAICRRFPEQREATQWQSLRPEAFWGMWTVFEYYETRRLLGHKADPEYEKAWRSDPSFMMVVEPRLRAWNAWARGKLAEADREADKTGIWTTPQVPHFDPDQVDDDLLRKAPPINRTVARTGKWDLRTIDLDGLLRHAGVGFQDAGDKLVLDECPWGSEHSEGKTGDAALFPPGGGRRAGFHCFHTSCSGRNIGDFLATIDPDLVSQFCEESQAAIDGGGYGPIQWPIAYPSGHKSSGRPIPHRIENLKAMLDHYGITIHYDLLQHREIITVPGMACEGKQEAGLATVMSRCREHGLQIEATKENLVVLRARNEFHPVADWIGSKAWDGTDRFSDLLASITLAPDYPADLAAELLKRWLIAGAKAVISKMGIAVQGVICFVGHQGIGKTRWTAALVPGEESGWVRLGIALDPNHKDSVMRATSCWIGELGEVDATFRKADIAALKAFLTAHEDVYRSPYARREDIHHRRTVYTATVNRPDFLADETGNRRFWVIEATRLDPEHGIELQQLWAQAAVLAEADEPHWLSPEWETRLAAIHTRHRSTDPVADALDATYVYQEASWVDSKTITDAVRDALGERFGWGQREQKKLASALREMCQAWQGGNLPRKNHGRREWPVRRRAGTPTQEDPLAMAVRVLDEP